MNLLPNAGEACGISVTGAKLYVLGKFGKAGKGLRKRRLIPAPKVVSAKALSEDRISAKEILFRSKANGAGGMTGGMENTEGQSADGKFAPLLQQHVGFGAGENGGITTVIKGGNVKTGVAQHHRILTMNANLGARFFR